MRDWQEIDSDEVTLDFVPTEQDLVDMEVAFAFNPDFLEKLEQLEKELDEVF